MTLSIMLMLLAMVVSAVACIALRNMRVVTTLQPVC